MEQLSIKQILFSRPQGTHLSFGAFIVVPLIAWEATGLRQASFSIAAATVPGGVYWGGVEKSSKIGRCFF